MKKLKFSYGSEKCVAIMRRKFEDLVTASIFMARSNRKWYQIKWVYVTSKTFLLTHVEDKQAIIDRLANAVAGTIACETRLAMANDLWRSL